MFPGAVWKKKFDLVVKATGHSAGLAGGPFQCGLALAFNLVFTADIKLEAALGFSGESGRLFFLVPREDGLVALGTAYLPFTGSLEITEGAVREFLAAAKHALPELPLHSGRLVQIESGVVPTRRQGSVSLKGRTEINVDGKVITLLTSKYTTFHSVGERVRRLADTL